MARDKSFGSGRYDTNFMRVHQFVSFLTLVAVCGCVSQPRKSADTTAKANPSQTEHVTGIGGVFFKANDPKGMAAFQGSLFVADKKRVWRIDASGKAKVFAPATAFPTTPLFQSAIL